MSNPSAASRSIIEVRDRNGVMTAIGLSRSSKVTDSPRRTARMTRANCWFASRNPIRFM
jgi:hypothetical protein